jgi:SEC-C motif
MGLGRNDPCHCGSGKKYKHCCLERDRARTSSPRPIRVPYPKTDRVLRTERDEKGRLLGKPFIEATWQGKRVRAVGSTIAIRPTTETDHEFFVSVLCKVLGDDWHKAQLELPEEERHVVERWVAEWDAVRGGEKEAIDKTQEAEQLFSATATGDLKALLCLAYDVYTLKHAMVLPDALVARLRRADQFQGARYEAAVAAVFVRAGYALDWITARDRKLPEFIARNTQTRSEIAVEAKSRHRPACVSVSASTTIATLSMDGSPLLGSSVR